MRTQGCQMHTVKLATNQPQKLSTQRREQAQLEQAHKARLVLVSVGEALEDAQADDAVLVDVTDEVHRKLGSKLDGHVEQQHLRVCTLPWMRAKEGWKDANVRHQQKSDA